LDTAAVQSVARSKAYYSIIQAAGDVARAERLNIGVALWALSDDFAKARDPTCQHA
jgi:hypothetical protein